MTYTEMLQEMVNNTEDIRAFAKSMQMSPQKIDNLLSGKLAWKAHDEKEVKSMYEMKKRVKAYTQRMNEFTL